MKKLTTLVLLAFFVLTGMSAQTTAKEQAQTLAERFFKQGQRVQSGTKGVRNVAATSLECRWDSRDVLPASSAAPTFYAFEPEVGQGFVIVAGDGDNARVIGYSYENTLPEAANMPDGLADFLGGVDAQVMAVRSGATAASVKAATPTGNVIVNLNTAPWGQRAPYNNLCKTSTGEAAATGCVPTAYSILMHYHKWPVCAENVSFPHPGTGKDPITLGYEYDWANMLSSYSGTYTDAQATAVATLMRDFGYANNVAYSTGSTGGNESATTLVKYFKYKSETPRNTGAAEAYVTGRDVVGSDATWKQYIKQSLDAGCPIPYSSTTTGGGRHVFICDGYTDADYYHFNWGWSGSGNGWFTLDNMTPDASSNYSNSHKAYFMLKPNRPTHVVSVEPSSYLMGTATINGSSVAVVEEGQKATLVATPNSTDYVFVKWTKGEELVSRSATTTVTITGADTYTAHFGEAAATADVEIAVAASTGGTATINGKDAVTIAVGEKITLVATPQSGYYFVNWTKDGEVVSTEATFSTTAQSYCTYTANFEAVETVTIKSRVNTGGYAYVGDGTVNSLSVEKGSQTKVRAVVNPESGKVFYFWTLASSYTNGGEIVSNKEVYEFVATTGVTYYANFFVEGTYAPVAISATASSGGEVTVNSASGSANVALGGDVVLSATPDYGYRFLNWTDGNGNVVSTEPNYTTVARAAANYTANFERLAAEPSTPPVVTLPEVTNGFIKGDGVLRFYRLALPITLSSFQNDFGSNATQVYAFWQEAETFLNKVYIPLGICFEVVEDARLIASSRNDIDNNPINAASYGTELTNGLIGEGSYDVGLWISLPADGDNSGVSALSGAYSKVAKGSGYAKADVTVVGHELGHLFGAQHVHDDYVHTEPGFGSSIMGYGDQLPFFSVASLRAIRSEMVSKNHSFYADAARTQLVGSNDGGNYVYGVVPGTSSAPMISATGMKASYSIPKGACFAMPIPATDANSDRLTYAFQQYEDGAMFRAYAPQENNVVDFRPSYVLWADDDNYFIAEDGSNIPSMAAGTYNFAAVVNDLPAASNMTLAAMQSNPFYSHYDAFQTQVTIVNGESFTVRLSPNKASYAAGDKVTVTWGVNSDYFGTKLVRILLSDDYGKTFKYTLAENVAATNGSCQVTMPDLNLTTVREQFGNYKTNVRPGIIRVEVVGDIAYSLSWTNPALATAEGGFLVTGGSGEGGGDEGEGEQTEDITAEKAALSNLLAEMKAYIATFATVEKYVMGGYTDYQVTFTADHGAVTADMVAEAYRAMDAAEATRETATTKAELNTFIAALQTKLTDLQTNKALPGEGEGGEGEDLTADKAALQALIADAEALIANCGQVVDKPATEEKIDLQVDERTGAFYLFTNADHNAYCSTDKRDGGGLTHLVDGITNSSENFFHSQWESALDVNKVSELHFLQVDLGAGNEMEEFKFNYVTRNSSNGSPYPTNIVVYGSEDGANFDTELANLSTGLPSGQGGAAYESAAIKCGSQYKSLRFTVAKSAEGGGAHPLFDNVYCFAMSEFGLTAVNPGGYEATVNPDTEVTSELLLATYEEVIEARAALLSATTVAELTAAKEALDARYNELLEASKNSTTDNLADEKTALQAVIDQTEALLETCAKVTVTETEQTVKLPLQTGDANADGHLYCNAPYVVDKNSTDYSPASEGYWLLDGDDKTFLHTNWDTKNNTADDDLDHYIRVYSAEALDKFTFTYTTRWNQTGDIWVGNPTVIEVEGSNEANGTYNTIATLSSGLPIQQKKTKAQVYTSDLLNPPTPYKYIRFRVTATEQNNSAHGHKWFYLSEFGFSKVLDVKEYSAALLGVANGVTEAIAIETYKAIEVAQASLTAETADELTAATDALQAQYDLLLAASESDVDKTPLRTIIDSTQALVDGCYEEKGTDMVFKYDGSLYITEAQVEAAAADIATAEGVYSLATLTQTELDTEVVRMQGVYNALAYAVSHALLPVQVTTDWANPYIYKIGIARTATSLLQLDASTPQKVDVAAKYEFGNEAQAWCFIDGTDGKVLIAPYQEVMAQQRETIAVSTGRYTASNNAGTYHQRWESTELVGLVFSTTANNMVTDGNNISIAPSIYGCTWTLKAPDGYEIVKYGFQFRNKDKGQNSQSNIIIGSTTYVSSDDLQSVEVDNVKSNSTTFRQSGDNIQVTLEDFYVVLKSPSVPVTTSSYNVLASNSLFEGAGKVAAVAKDSDGYVQEWTIVPNAKSAGWYNIYCENANADKFYFSHNGGGANKMGFYNSVDDAGTKFQFGALESSSFDFSDAYNNLYNFVHNDITIHHTLEGHNTAVGYYTEDMANAYNAAYEAANTALDAVADDATCEACYTALFDANSALEINMPLPGRYYRFRSASTKDYCKDALMYADPETHSLRWSKEKRDDDATTYWCFYMGGSAGNYAIENLHTGTSTPQNGFGSFASMVGAGAQISITSLSTEGKVGIYSKGTMMHAQETDQVIVNWSGDENSASAWYIEEANIYDVVYSINISKYGYAGMHLNYSVKVPDEVDAYAVTNATGESGTATLTKIENGIVPANTGVILTSSMAKEDPNGKTYELEYTTSGASVSSWLKGSNYKTLLKADANMDYYLFGVKSGVVALYKAYKELTLDGKNCRDLTDDEITAVTSTLPQAGYVYYLCNKHMKGDVYFSDNGNAIGFNKSSDAAYKYKWECIVENGQYMFRNLETGKYFGWQGLSNNAYAWELYDTVQKDYGEGLQAGCVSMKNGDFLVVENASEWDKSSKDGYYNNQFSSSFYFVPVGKMTTKTNEGGYFKCSANKIYLPYSTAANAAKFSFRFDEGTTTDLEEALFGKDAKEEIFDLQGRRIERITAPGLYIVNGQKRYVKAVKF